MKRMLFLLAVPFLALSLSGCPFSGEDGDEGGPTTPASDDPFPDTADQLMSNFTHAWSEMDGEHYADLLADGFVFRFLPSDLVDLDPPGGDCWYAAAELQAIANMFAGDPGWDGVSTIPGISDITFELFDLDGGWSETDNPEEFPGAWRAVYNVQLSFLRAGATTVSVSGQALFYVTSREVRIGGETRTRHELAGWIDGTGIRKGTVDDSWGRMKANYY